MSRDSRIPRIHYSLILECSVCKTTDVFADPKDYPELARIPEKPLCRHCLLDRNLERLSP